MAQTSYTIDIPAVSYPGQIADASKVLDVLSVLNVAAAIPFGVFVSKDLSNSGGFDKLAGKVPATGTDITTLGSLLGVALCEQTLAQDSSVAVPTWPIKSAMPVMRKGRVWVLSETDVTDGAQIYVRHTASGGNTQLGKVRKDADSATAALAPGCVFRGTYASAGYVCVEIDLA